MLFAADNIQITQKTVGSALKSLNPVPIQEIVRNCDSAGVNIIDVNTGPLKKNPEENMAFFINTVQQVTGLPIMIDTANPKAMEAGLSVCRNKSIINGFSLEPEKLKKILPLARDYDSDIIGYLLYNDSRVPADSSERLNLALTLYEEVHKAGISPDKLIIDPVLVPLIWENGTFQAMEVLKVIRMLPELLGFPVRTIVGLSNLTTGAGPFNKKRIMEKAYVSMLAEAGLSITLLNAFHHETLETAKASSILKKMDIFSYEELTIKKDP